MVHKIFGTNRLLSLCLVVCSFMLLQLFAVQRSLFWIFGLCHSCAYVLFTKFFLLLSLANAVPPSAGQCDFLLSSPHIHSNVVISSYLSSKSPSHWSFPGLYHLHCIPHLIIYLSICISATFIFFSSAFFTSQVSLLYISWLASLPIWRLFIAYSCFIFCINFCICSPIPYYM